MSLNRNTAKKVPKEQSRKGFEPHFTFGTYATCKYCGIELPITRQLGNLRKHLGNGLCDEDDESQSITLTTPVDEKEEKIINEEDWRYSTATINNKLDYLFDTSLYSDLILSVNNGKTKKEFKVHQFILSLSSEVFDAAINGNFKESSTKLIEIYDIEHDIFELFLRFLYTNNIEIKSVEESMELYEVAHKYMVHHLKEICLNYLRENINASVACIGFEFSSLYMIEDLKLKYLFVIQTQTEDIISHVNFLNANVETLRTILNQNMLTASEFDIFIAIEKWINNMIEINGQKIKEELCEKIVKKVRYFNMTPEEFIEGPVNSGLLKEDQWAPLLANIVSDKCLIPLPDGFMETLTQLPFYNINDNS